MSKQRPADSIKVCCTPIGEQALDADEATHLARVFKALGDPVRLRIVSLIASAPDGEVCVCDLNAPFDVAGPTISHHLKVLREAGLIDGERRGTWIYYRIVPGALTGLSTLLDAARTSPAMAGATA
jgi:ArsR family transcriptional regulator